MGREWLIFAPGTRPCKQKLGAPACYIVPMRRVICSLLLAASSAAAQERAANIDFPAASAERFARLALECVHKEYPNKISHVLRSDADVAPPRQLTPAFFGCYDWHSSVHGHWLLARLARAYPKAPFAGLARTALQRSITADHIKTETAYLRAEGRASFERPYGLAWLLQVAAELRQWDDPDAQALAAHLLPLEQAAVERLKTWLPKLSHPLRVGEHSQTAFAMGLMLDYARSTADRGFEQLLLSRARKYYLRDRLCPLAYEPGGEDFLSPCLAEADLMRRVLPPSEYSVWLARFLPGIPKTARAEWLPVAVTTDPSDPKLAHLDGLNLSRAWMLEGIAAGLAAGDRRRLAINAAAQAHRRAGLAAVTGEHYEGGHWLGSFAVYLVTRRGLVE